jgi:hypothetical protein
MSWRLAHIVREGDDYVVTLPENPAITARSRQLEHALERVKLSLCAWIPGRRRLVQSHERALKDTTFEGSIALIETPDHADYMPGRCSYSARRRSARLVRAQDARVQTGSLLVRSRIRNTTSP